MISQSLSSVFSCFLRPLFRGISLCAAWVFQHSSQSVIEQRLHQDKAFIAHSQSSHKGNSGDPRVGDSPTTESYKGFETSWSSVNSSSSNRLKNEASSSSSSSSLDEGSSEKTDEDLLIQSQAVSGRNPAKM